MQISANIAYLVYIPTHKGRTPAGRATQEQLPRSMATRDKLIHVIHSHAQGQDARR